MKTTVGILLGILLVILSGGLLLSPYYFLAPLIPIGIIGFLVLYHFPQLGVLGLIFFVPLEGLFAGNKLFTGSKLLGIAMIGIVGLRLLFGHTQLQNLKSRQWIPIAILVAVFIASGLMAPYGYLSKDMLKDLVTAIIIFVIAIAAGDQLKPVHLMMAMAISVAITAALSLFTTSHALEGRATGLMTDPNYFALLLVTAIPFTLYLIIHSPWLPVKLFWFVLIALDMMALQKTMSRSGLLVLFMALMTLGWHHRALLRSMTPRHVGLFIALGTVAIAIVAALMPKEYMERILSLANFSGVENFEDRSLGRRTSYVVVGMNLFLDHPFFGAGPGHFPVYYSQSGFATAFSEGMSDPEIFRRAHNTYLELLAETGLVGFAAFTVLALGGLMNFFRARQRALQLGQIVRANEVTYMGATFLALIVFLLFLSATQHKYFWVFIALSELARRSLYSTTAEIAAINKQNQNGSG